MTEFWEREKKRTKKIKWNLIGLFIRNHDVRLWRHRDAYLWLEDEHVMGVAMRRGERGRGGSGGLVGGKRGLLSNVHAWNTKRGLWNLPLPGNCFFDRSHSPQREWVQSPLSGGMVHFFPLGELTQEGHSYACMHYCMEVRASGNETVKSVHIKS